MTEKSIMLSAGDWVRVDFGHGELRDVIIEEFRQCLGFFADKQYREAGRFTPLCNMYGPGPKPEEKYIGNYGSYYTNEVPLWMNIPSKKVK